MPNALANATSPYLLQHANNPVNWVEWGPEALSEAQRRDVPILLSVGYSACHWCHVMERESFEDPETARQMNADFVCIKVDREERPDIDALYMATVQALQGRGGWPMTVFCKPDGTPFYGGTYYPPEPRYGMPSFSQLMARMKQLYAERGSPTESGDIEHVADQLFDFLEASGKLPDREGALEDGWLARTAEAASTAYDPTHGGFSGAPKFPSHTLLEALLAHVQRTAAAGAEDERTLSRVVHTLDAMAQGGMYDLLAGGFARYSVDAAWRVPHFEKMLYDNAQLVPVYLAAYQRTGHARFARIARETLGWMTREMQPDGGFLSATDADSEGVEGKYFSWTPAQLREVLGDDAPRVAALLNVTEAGTFEHGMSVLRLETPLEQLDPADRQLLADAFPKLLAVRSERVPPATDDKVVTAWNAMAISACAKAAFVLDEPVWRDAAVQAADFVREHLTTNAESGGRLMRSWRDGRTSVPAFSDDYALWLVACLDLYDATFDPVWIERASDTADALLGLFWDHQTAGVFTTGSDVQGSDALVARMKAQFGGAEPGANAVVAQGFVRLGRLLDRPDLLEHATAVLERLQSLHRQATLAFGKEAVAASWLLGGGREVGLVPGSAGRAGIEPLLAPLRATHDPFRVVAVGADVPWMADRPAVDGRPTAYVCEGFTCQLPVTSAGALADQL